MVLSILKRRERTSGHRPPAYPPGKRIYCIGDIHGRDDLLEELHERIQSDAAAYKGLKSVLYLGDYIDRGPASKQVINRLLQQPLEGFEQIFLLGNHEQALLDFLTDARAMASWMAWGGMETLRSYGIPLFQPLQLHDMEALAIQLASAMPQSHLEFFRNLDRSYQAGGYYFVHAGIRPGVPLKRQELGDQLWIREEFTRSSQQHEAVIVHGHSISRQVEILPNRIGIDTGAFHTGVLTALVLEDETQRLIQTGNASTW